MNVGNSRSASRPFARSGLLIAMLVGAAIGMTAGRAIESATGGADPDFVSTLGAAFGGILGRSIWSRVLQSRRPGGRSLSAAMLLLGARVAICALVGIALIGPESLGAPWTNPIVRGGAALVGGALLVALGVAEYRHDTRRGNDAPTPAGQTHVD